MRPVASPPSVLAAAAVLAAALALAGCGDRKPPVAETELPPGAVAPVKAAQTEAFSLPQDRPSRGGAPPSTL